MSKIKVSIINSTTLKLEEDGIKGDIIDLKDLTSVDNSQILEAIKNQKDSTYEEKLKNVIKDQENAKKLALMDLENKLKNDYRKIKDDNLIKQTAIEKEFNDKKMSLESKIKELEQKLENEKQLVTLELQNKNIDILNEKEKEILKLKNDLELEKQSKILNEKNIKDKYDNDLKEKQAQIDYYKDLKTKVSTKLLGENLEQHCFIEFNKLRSTAFKNSYFEKDNDSRTGSKGDFIFREYIDENQNEELISIMFEMKNEADTTATKHKNEDFFKELNKDRIEKKCEYAILVSMLESDNELYNQGIVDVSYKYAKMYVIRPQFFIPIITILRDAALNVSSVKHQLIDLKNQNIDISNFEDNLNEFKTKFGNNYRLASEKFNKAIDEIDKSISALNKVKEALLSSENNLRLANDKAEDLSIKKLTKNAPTLKKAFDDIIKEK